jgi:hypothetical protein
MSASTERKNRQTARSEGSYAKDINAKKEADKKKKQRTKWIIVGVALVIFFAFAIYLNSGALYRSLDALTVKNTEVTVGDTTISAGERGFSVAECNYVYHMQYISLMNTYGNYASTLLHLDTTKPLDEQECPSFMNKEGKENYTWDQYFRDATKSQLKQLAAYEAYAGQHDIKLDDDDLKEIDDTIASIAETAKKNNYGSVSKFLAANYGRGCNESVARAIMELQTLAGKVQTSITDVETYTAEQLAEKYDSVKDSYDKFTYSYYLVAAELPEHEHSEDEDEHAHEPTDEAKAAAKATAEEILAKLSDGTSLADAAKAVVTDAEIKEQTDLAGSSVETALSEWIKSADRKAGDTAVVDSGTGSYVVVFTKRDNNQAPTEESGDQNYCDYVAENLLKQDVLSEWNEHVFSGIVEAYKGSYNGSSRYVGL